MLNMFRMLIHPSSGACDSFVKLFHGLYCSVRIEVIALACLFNGECLVVTCVVVLESVFLQKHYQKEHTTHKRNSITIRHRSKICRNTLSKTTTHVTTKHMPLNKHANAITSILTEQYNPWNNSTYKSQAPDDGCINIRNMLALNNEIIKQVHQVGLSLFNILDAFYCLLYQVFSAVDVTVTVDKVMASFKPAQT